MTVSSSLLSTIPAAFFDPHHIGIHRTNDLVIIQITWNEGRSTEQKKALYKAIADDLRSAGGLRREDVFMFMSEDPH
jgi:4-oxalocrotonate tautomerase